MDQCTDVVLFREEGSPFSDSFGQQGRNTGVWWPLGGIDNIVATVPHRLYGLGDDVGVGKDAQATRRRS